jgi:hypothetical protein
MQPLDIEARDRINGQILRWGTVGCVSFVALFVVGIYLAHFQYKCGSMIQAFATNRVGMITGCSLAGASFILVCISYVACEELAIQIHPELAQESNYHSLKNRLSSLVQRILHYINPPPPPPPPEVFQFHPRDFAGEEMRLTLRGRLREALVVPKTEVEVLSINSLPEEVVSIIAEYQLRCQFGRRDTLMRTFNISDLAGDKRGWCSLSGFPQVTEEDVLGEFLKLCKFAPTINHDQSIPGLELLNVRDNTAQDLTHLDLVLSWRNLNLTQKFNVLIQLAHAEERYPDVQAYKNFSGFFVALPFLLRDHPREEINLDAYESLLSKVSITGNEQLIILILRHYSLTRLGLVLNSLTREPPDNVSSRAIRNVAEELFQERLDEDRDGEVEFCIIKSCRVAAVDMMRRVIAAFLKERDVNQPFEGGKTLLHHAVEGAVCKKIVMLDVPAREASLDWHVGEQHETDHHSEIRHGNYPEAVQLLLTHGANPHLPDSSGQTPLQLATTEGLEDLIKLMMG